MNSSRVGGCAIGRSSASKRAGGNRRPVLVLLGPGSIAPEQEGRVADRRPPHGAAAEVADFRLRFQLERLLRMVLEPRGELILSSFGTACQSVTIFALSDDDDLAALALHLAAEPLGGVNYFLRRQHNLLAASTRT